MNKLTAVQAESLPALIHRAAAALDGATTSAEVLEARDTAKVAYDAAKSAGRMARAKKAHDEVLSAVYRAQADALLIEARAKMRLADEYDAAQERGEVATGNRTKDFSVASDNAKPATAADLGLRRDEIHEARQLRDLERDNPGEFERVTNEIVERGEEPTKASIRRAFVEHNTGNNEWYTPPEIVEAARAVLGEIELDPATSEIANEAVRAAEFYTIEDDALSLDWPPSKIWMNPPYAAGLVSKFIGKFIEAAQTGATGIVLVNNATETGWFQDLASVASAICFHKGRIRYVTPEGALPGAPLQGQAIFYVGEDSAGFVREFSRFGAILHRSAE